MPAASGTRPKPKDFKGLWEKIVEYAKSDPEPLYPSVPSPPIELSADQLLDIKDGGGEFGYPLIEILARKSHVRLLYEKERRIKYRDLRPSAILLVLKLLEESGKKPAEYCINISQVVNQKDLTYSLESARTLVSNAKHLLEDALGLSCSPETRNLKLTTLDEYKQGLYYHDRNMVKAVGRIQDLIKKAHTRRLLGDSPSDCPGVPDVYRGLIPEGNAAYDSRFLGKTDSRSYEPMNTLPRHLL